MVPIKMDIMKRNANSSAIGKILKSKRKFLNIQCKFPNKSSEKKNQNGDFVSEGMVRIHLQIRVTYLYTAEAREWKDFLGDVNI